MIKRFLKMISIVLIGFICLIFCGCENNEKVIKVCASEIPHAQILNEVVKEALKEKGYTLEVSYLDWTLQNDSVASKDYDANYFQHVPYLNTYNGQVKLIPVVKVHYEPLGIYYGKKEMILSNGKTFSICNDESNAIRALELLYELKIIDELPVANEKLTFSQNTWTSKNGVTITLIAEELLVASMSDYDFTCLPCNTACTGNVSYSKMVAREENKELVFDKANIIAVRENDYIDDPLYKAKIDALCEVLLSVKVREFIASKYDNIIICNDDSQVDLRK